MTGARAQIPHMRDRGRQIFRELLSYKGDGIVTAMMQELAVRAEKGAGPHAGPAAPAAADSPARAARRAAARQARQAAARQRRRATRKQ